MCQNSTVISIFSNPNILIFKDFNSDNIPLPYLNLYLLSRTLKSVITVQMVEVYIFVLHFRIVSDRIQAC